ncbi:MAG: hypothetical protein BJ554DRAFT_4825 [Olpidium bornovanus]|uniref:Uncharacterized protein n=1 Tax=Olpidium bornovanus TaxID=278681 RepID=A0A8H8DEY9_9FUNG|nr:MAG: hypothetical protein BJ554DRAFT_4825 [Olpidium bornovanus]
MLLSRSRTAPEAWPTAFSSPDRVAAGDGDAAPKGPPRDDELVEALMARLSEKEADAALAAEVGQELLKEVTVLKRRLADLESAASGGLAPEGAGAGGAFPRLAACFLVTGAEGVPATPDENAPPPAVRDLPLTLERQHSDLRPALANMRPVSAVAAGSRHRTPASPVRRIQMRQLVAASPSYNVKNNASLCTVWGNSGTPSLLSPLMAEEEEENQTSISEMKPNSPKGGADADVPDQSVRFPLRDLTDPFQDRDGEGGVKHNAAAESQMFQSVVKSLSLRIAILEREKGEIQERVMDAEREGNAAKRALARKEENEGVWHFRRFRGA